MRKAFLILVTGIFILVIILFSSVYAIECGSIPTNNCFVTQNTTFLKGNYYLPNGITIGANNVVLNCNDAVLNGNGVSYSFGIKSSTSGVTIKNCNVKQFNRGIYLSLNSRNTLLNNNLSDTEYAGIEISQSSNNILQSNIVNNNKGSGISLYFSSSNLLVSNIANNNKDNGDGISLFYSSNNILNNNVANNNTWGVIISDQASNNILNNNVANNNLWGIIIWYNSNNTLNNNTADNNQENGIWLTNTKNNTLTKNTANNNRYGAYLYSTSANNILLSNLFCNNLVNDIKDADSNSGDKNTCDTIFNWNDIGTIGCTYGCSPPSPPKPNCTDNIKNQNETDVDCGGNCDKCADGKSCLSKDDCQSHYCAGGLCLICPIENLTTNPFSYSGDYVFNESRLSEKEKEVLPYVYKYSKEYEISPALIMAIIKKESNFNSESYGDQFKGYYCDELFKKKLIKDLKCEFRAYGYMQLWATAACDGGFGGEELNITQPLDYTWWYKWFIARYFCVNNSDCKIKFEAAHGNQNKKENLVALYNWFKLPATKQALQFSFSAKEEAKAESSFFAYVDWPVQGIEANTNIHYGSGYLKKQYVRYSNPKRVYKDALKNTISAYHNGNAIADNKYVEPVIQYYEDYKSKAIC